MCGVNSLPEGSFYFLWFFLSSFLAVFAPGPSTPRGISIVRALAAGTASYLSILLEKRAESNTFTYSLSFSLSTLPKSRTHAIYVLADVEETYF